MHFMMPPRLPSEVNVMSSLFLNSLLTTLRHKASVGGVTAVKIAMFTVILSFRLSIFELDLL